MVVYPLRLPPSHLLTVASPTEDFLIIEEKHHPWSKKPTKLHYPPMTSYTQTYAQRAPMVQHLMLYLLQITKFIPETFSTSSKLIQIISEVSTNVPLTFEFLTSFRNYSETSKVFLNYLEIFRNTSLSSEVLPAAQSHRNNPKTSENTSK